LDLTLIDPCDSATVSITQPNDWAASIWTADPETYAFSTATDVSYTTDPSGADCGDYTVSFTLATGGSAADSSLYDDSTANQITIDLGNDGDNSGTYTLTTLVSLSSYGSQSATDTLSITATDPCTTSSAITITIDEDDLLSWDSTMIIYESESFVFDNNWVTISYTTTNVPICGSLSVDFELYDDDSNESLSDITVSPSTTATIDFSGESSSVGTWSL